MATSEMTSLPASLKPSFAVEKTAMRGLPSLARTSYLLRSRPVGLKR